MQDPELWDRLEAYEFPPKFEEKLGAAGGWIRSTTGQVREEYRRFVYLALISKGEATPSRAVDLAWHTHLSFTRDYWGRFCREALGREFHHDPCEDAASMPRYRAQYAQTRALYAEEFGTPPPERVWPTGRSTWSLVAGIAVFGLGVLLMILGMPEWDGSLTPLGFSGIVVMVLAAIFTIFTLPLSGRAVGGTGGGVAGCGGGCGGGGG